MSNLTMPTIHLNGTSRSELLEQQVVAIDAVRKAIDALQQASPNGRDYYVQGGHAFTAAREEHTSRLSRLVEVRKELEEIAEHTASVR